MRQALARPADATVSLRLSYADVLNRLQRDDELKDVLAQLQKTKLSAEDKVKYSRIQLDYDIRQALRSGDDQKAIALLKRAVDLDKEDVWLRLDLARLYAKTNHPKLGIALFTDYLKGSPKNVEGLYAYALYLSGLEQNQAALEVLEKIPSADRTPKIARFQRSVWVDLQIEQAKVFYGQGDQGKAAAMLESLEPEVSPNPDLLALVASTWAKIDQQARGDALFQKIQAQNPTLSIDWHLRYANYLLNHDQEVGFKKEMSFLAGQKLSPAQKQDYAELVQAAELQAIDLTIRAGEVQKANDVSGQSNSQKRRVFG